MTALESMKENLKSTGLYRLTGETMADAELAAYGAELDALRAALEELECERFSVTACGKGLSMREAAYRMNGEGKSKEERRTAVLGRGAVTVNGFSRSEVERVLLSEGLRVEFYENTEAQKVCISFLDEITKQKDRLKALHAVVKFLPAHLDAELDFRSLSWNTIDRAEFSFDDLDAKELTWSGIDNYQNAVMPLDFI